MKTVNEMAIEAIPPAPQTQISLHEQIVLLILAANKLGLYDAADWLINNHNKNDK